MISCDKGIINVAGDGNRILAEWATLTYAIIREFTENYEGKESKENLKEKMREALEMDFEMAFKMLDGETFEETIKPMKKTILKSLLESWKI